MWVILFIITMTHATYPNEVNVGASHWHVILSSNNYYGEEGKIQYEMNIPTTTQGCHSIVHKISVLIENGQTLKLYSDLDCQTDKKIGETTTSESYYESETLNSYKVNLTFVESKFSQLKTPAMAFVESDCMNDPCPSKYIPYYLLATPEEPLFFPICYRELGFRINKKDPNNLIAEWTDRDIHNKQAQVIFSAKNNVISNVNGHNLLVRIDPLDNSNEVIKGCDYLAKPNECLIFEKDSALTLFLFMSLVCFIII